MEVGIITILQNASSALAIRDHTGEIITDSNGEAIFAIII